MTRSFMFTFVGIPSWHLTQPSRLSMSCRLDMVYLGPHRRFTTRDLNQSYYDMMVQFASYKTISHLNLRRGRAVVDDVHSHIKELDARDLAELFTRAVQTRHHPVNIGHTHDNPECKCRFVERRMRAPNLHCPVKGNRYSPLINASGMIPESAADQLLLTGVSASKGATCLKCKLQCKDCTCACKMCNSMAQAGCHVFCTGQEMMKASSDVHKALVHGNDGDGFKAVKSKMLMDDQSRQMRTHPSGVVAEGRVTQTAATTVEVSGDHIRGDVRQPADELLWADAKAGGYAVAAYVHSPTDRLSDASWGEKLSSDLRMLLRSRESTLCASGESRSHGVGWDEVLLTESNESSRLSLLALVAEETVGRRGDEAEREDRQISDLPSIGTTPPRRQTNLEDMITKDNIEDITKAISSDHDITMKPIRHPSAVGQVRLEEVSIMGAIK